MYTDIRWQQRFQNYERAFLSLVESKEAFFQDPTNLFIRDSLIQRYEYTIELAWKTLKDFLEDEGFADSNTPKKVIRQAFQAGHIQHGDVWLQALDDRNQTSHAYEEKMAIAVVQDICEKYFLLMEELYAFFKKQSKES